MKVIRTSNPASEPCTVSEAKEHLRVTDDADTVYIAGLISAARARVEQYCNRAFASAGFAVVYDGDLPTGDTVVSVPVADVTAVVVKYRDGNGAIQTWAAENYRHDPDRQTLTPLAGWPAGTDLRVEVTAGATPPEDIKYAIKLVLADMYELRTIGIVGTSVAENPAAEALMNPHRERMGI